MKLFWIVTGILAALVLLVLLTAYVCFRMAFFVSKKERAKVREYDLPPGRIYKPYHGVMLAWMKEVRTLPHEDVSIKSFDGLTLYGRFYEYAPGAPIELMFHGYRGTADRDLCGGVQRCFALRRSALVVDQRTSGKSEGSVISFGINESRDCLRWIDFMLERFGPDVKIILTGVSMGASTVMIAAGNPLPANILGVLADCGFSSAREIIKKEIRHMKLPAGLLYPFVKLGARLFGRFDLEETTAENAMTKCTVPVIFFHGDNDKYVPCEMSRACYDACTSRKLLHTVPGAGHGLSFPADQETYLRVLGDFFGPDASAPL